MVVVAENIQNQHSRFTPYSTLGQLKVKKSESEQQDSF
jgi:hypothetical protein